ncbi:MAG: radical SAM protein [Deltaproteobacteria bacterium]|nr:radical SAM protein [Deltaproteobacteria bacterium]
MRYEGPIYRPPSEARSLLIQATVGCPHNRCTFCLVYKKIRFKVRPTAEVVEDLEEARRQFGPGVETLFLPAGNTIAMPAPALAEVCRAARRLFPGLRRITVYGSAQYVVQQGPEKLRMLAEAGLSRVHLGLESGDDEVLRRVHKGSTAAVQTAAGRMLREAGIEVNLYVVLGLGGKERSAEHARETVRVVNDIAPDVLRLRTFVPKINTPLLEDVLAGRFQMLSPHQVLRETLALVEGLRTRTEVASDHYTNYLDVSGRLPEDRERLRVTLRQALARDETTFRAFFIGRE